MGKRDSAVVSVAVAMFGVGLLALLALFLTPVVTDSTAPTWVYLLTPLIPVGFIVGVIGVVVANRTSSRRSVDP